MKKTTLLLLIILLAVLMLSACSKSPAAEGALPSANQSTESTAPADEASAPSGSADESQSSDPLDATITNIENQFKSFLKNENLSYLDLYVYSNDDQRIVIQAFVKDGTELMKDLEIYKQEFESGSALSAENQKKWDTLTGSFEKICLEVTQQFHSDTMFQLIDNKGEPVFLQINNGKKVSEYFVKQQ